MLQNASKLPKTCQNTLIPSEFKCTKGEEQSSYINTTIINYSINGKTFLHESI